MPADAAAAAAAAGVPSALVQQLRSTADAGMLAAATRALSVLASSCDAGVHSAIRAAGGAGALVEQLCSGGHTPGTIAALLRALVNLTGPGGVWAAAGSQHQITGLVAPPRLLPRLVQLLGDAAGPAAQAAACYLLANLSACKQAAAAVVSAGVAPALAAMMSSADAGSELQAGACELVGRLADADHSAALLAAGLEPHLQRLAASHQPPVSNAAVRALQQLLGRPSSAAVRGSSPALAPAAKPASGQQQRSRRTCAAPSCTATGGLRRCGGCGTVRYCSEACSRAHWKAHRAECRRLQADQAAAAAAVAGGGEGEPKHAERAACSAAP